MTGDAESVDVPQELLKLLDEFVAGLSAVGEDFWARWMKESRERIGAGDAYGVRHLLSASGGSGSLNDLQLDPDLCRLRSRILTIADDTWRLLRRGI